MIRVIAYRWLGDKIFCFQKHAHTHTQTCTRAHPIYTHTYAYTFRSSNKCCLIRLCQKLPHSLVYVSWKVYTGCTSSNNTSSDINSLRWWNGPLARGTRVSTLILYNHLTIIIYLLAFWVVDKQWWWRWFALSSQWKRNCLTHNSS